MISQPPVKIYDTTLRDGTQSEGISFSKVDKVRIAQKLDAFGVSYIEGGWPGSNPTDMGFFHAMKDVELKQAKLAAFGSTRRAKNKPEDDPNLQTLLEADTPVVTIFGKAWKLHVDAVLKVSVEQNLQMVEDSCRFLKANNKEVIFDAEHFFDGYNDDPDFAIGVLKAAIKGGAEAVVLCDTNGGAVPSDIQRICLNVQQKIGRQVELGIHCHNDSNCAVANSLVGVENGCTHVQGTINGLGERCGNANLCSIVPGIELKTDKNCIPPGSLKHLTELSNFVFDMANQRPENHQPYTGTSAFAHKGGMHVNAVQKNPVTFEHIDPEIVGNERRILVSDLSGGTNIMMKAAEHDIQLDQKGPEVRQILQELKKLEAQGYEYEAADGSFWLLIQKTLKKHSPFFHLEGFRVIIEKRGPDEPCLSEATLKIRVGDRMELTAAEGDGPVNALDRALRKGLTSFYPEIAKVHLRDFKVRILEGDEGTAAKTRVLIESGDGEHVWGTVGVSENIIEASWEALVDSVEYILYRKNAK
ncbi:MAG: citramalate synthase [Lentisphaeria bacterium]